MDGIEEKIRAEYADNSLQLCASNSLCVSRIFGKHSNFVLNNTTRTFFLQSAYVFFWKFKFNFSCQPIDYSNSEYGRAEVYYTYVYFLFKVLDLCDTVSYDLDSLSVLIYSSRRFSSF